MCHRYTVLHTLCMCIHSRSTRLPTKSQIPVYVHNLLQQTIWYIYTLHCLFPAFQDQLYTLPAMHKKWSQKILICKVYSVDKYYHKASRQSLSCVFYEVRACVEFSVSIFIIIHMSSNFSPFQSTL